MTVKAQSYSIRGEKTITAFGVVDVDAAGIADVPDEMAKAIESGAYGETWSVIKTKQAKASKEEEKKTGAIATARNAVRKAVSKKPAANGKKKTAKKKTRG